MRLRVLFFGVLRDRFSLEERLEQFPGSTVSDLLHYYKAVAPELGPLWGKLAVAVNQEYALGNAVLQQDDEVALLPPVSGGTASMGNMQVELVEQPIDTPAIVARLKAGADGAVTVFDGIVRNNTKGRQTLYLHYTAHESMALRQMRELATEAISRFGVRDVAMVHRLGRLEIGETSILIAVASAHRGVTFDACRWLIDTLKQQVPIWKQEFFVDGAMWAAGEPFPAALLAGNAPGTE